jgi:hypothetical protein
MHYSNPLSHAKNKNINVITILEAQSIQFYGKFEEEKNEKFNLMFKFKI